MEKRRATIIFDDEGTPQNIPTYMYNERKTLKVDPPVYDLIKKISSVTDVRIYELVEDMANEYLNSHLSNKQKEIVQSIIK